MTESSESSLFGELESLLVKVDVLQDGVDMTTWLHGAAVTSWYFGLPDIMLRLDAAGLTWPLWCFWGVTRGMFRGVTGFAVGDVATGRVLPSCGETSGEAGREWWPLLPSEDFGVSGGDNVV